MKLEDVGRSLDGKSRNSRSTLIQEVRHRRARGCGLPASRLRTADEVGGTRGPTERLTTGLRSLTLKSPGKSLLHATETSVAAGLLFFATACLHHHRTPAPGAVGAAPPNAPPTTTVTVPPERTPAIPVPSCRAKKASPPGTVTPITAGPRRMAKFTTCPPSAPRTAPCLRTLVRVHDLENGKDVTVRINDRGPFVQGRIIDLSYAAAQAMAINRDRAGPVGSSGYDTTPLPGIFAVQIGAFHDRRNADRLKALVEASYGPVVVQGFDRGDGFSIAFGWVMRARKPLRTHSPTSCAASIWPPNRSW